MGYLTDVVTSYVRVRLLVVLLAAVLVGVVAALSPLLDDGNAPVGVFGVAILGLFLLLAVHAIPR